MKPKRGAQLALFELPEPPPPPWVKIRAGNHGGCGAVWEHTSGWQVIHCGHPTANYPWYAMSPEGKRLTLANGNFAFAYLKEIKRMVELELAAKDEQ